VTTTTTTTNTKAPAFRTTGFRPLGYDPSPGRGAPGTSQGPTVAQVVQPLVETVLGRPVPVRFEKGRTTAVLKGAADHANGKTYVLAARKGQTMTLHVTSAARTAIFSLTAPSGAVEGALEVKDWSGELPDTGEYLVAVWNTRKRGAVPYTLEITIR
jgi:hypothetical protein